MDSTQDVPKPPQKNNTYLIIFVVIALGGFLTLIVVAILAGIVLVAVNPQAQVEKARDAGRLQELSNLTKAIQLSIIDGEIELINTSDCRTCESSIGTTETDGTSGWVKFKIPAGKTGLSKYLLSLPKDPTNTKNYAYQFSSDGTNYEINAIFEAEINASKMSADKGNNDSVYEVGSNLTLIK
ncbi:hypothetical protein A2716_02005 [candidate division WWE3 bacterium RIFCSPHIGHO2_01_FULL_40_23]|uniref:Uncharacterized protein n=1 Tax=candidate division WWE3 bacterium RIFCSPLOWO2_01_FULL_41_18 TaxID=1802625 RepID=A0A1F4VF26_UNCKA|nr:MAG: hypothetical protein A2716_02005 [candidate division WWE3 bacterium RIFCSPHIGHO2_01_FULL_40_23]OGC55764.1 MAG: hypothetical protein A3A78_01855 [candidate division WWE3 bacterium RIFCSPLOWO2_01_FULL_41_18]